jgi:hypothetical protein
MKTSAELRNVKVMRLGAGSGGGGGTVEFGFNGVGQVGRVAVGEDEHDDVVAEVPLPLELLAVLVVVGQVRRHVEHHFIVFPRRVHAVRARRIDCKHRRAKKNEGELSEEK